MARKRRIKSNLQKYVEIIFLLLVLLTSNIILNNTTNTKMDNKSNDLYKENELLENNENSEENIKFETMDFSISKVEQATIIENNNIYSSVSNTKFQTQSTRKVPIAPISSASELWINPSEDTYVTSTKPTINFGSAFPLTFNDGLPSYILLKYDLSGFHDYITSTTIEWSFDVWGASNTNLQVYETNSNWDQHSVTWNTKPQLGTLLGSYSGLSQDFIYWGSAATNQYLKDNIGGSVSFMLASTYPYMSIPIGVALNIKIISELDTGAPVIANIAHTPNNPNSSQDITISADISDTSAIDTATLFYQENGASWQNTPMIFNSGISYSTTLSSRLEGTIIKYYVTADDSALSNNSAINDNSGNYYNVSILDTSQPIIDSPIDILYYEGSTSNTITWIASDFFPNIYSVSLDGYSYLTNISWTTGAITVNVDGLSEGIFTFIITIYDDAGNSASDSVIITVLDGTNPTVNSPLDISYGEGNTGNSISWVAIDLHPDVYTVTRDGSLIVPSTSWNSSIGVIIVVDGFSLGVYVFEITFYDLVGNQITDQVIVTVTDGDDPTVSSPADKTYEDGNTGNLITWTASDSNPGFYSITVDGTAAIIDQSWTGVINFNVDGFNFGVHSVVIIVKDISDKTVIDTVLVTVTDTVNPTVDSPSNYLYYLGSTANTINWTLSDNNPNTYSITINSVANKTNVVWSSGTVNINVDGLSIGIYTFAITIYDDAGNSATDIVIISVDVGSVPQINNPNDIIISEGSTGNSIIWNGLDLNPDTYTVTMNNSAFSNGNWVSGDIIVNADELSIGVYEFEITIYDIQNNLSTDIVIITVIDDTNPVINSPDDITLGGDSTGNKIIWTASDTNPNVYSIIRDGILIVDRQIWISGSIGINIDGLKIGIYNFTISLYDDIGNFVSDTVMVIVADGEYPVFMETPNDISIELGDTVLLSWKGIDDNADTYIIKSGSSILANGSWQSGVVILFDISKLQVGEYDIILELLDISGNSIADKVHVSIIFIEFTSEPEDEYVIAKRTNGPIITFNWGFNISGMYMYKIMLDDIVLNNVDVTNSTDGLSFDYQFFKTTANLEEIHIVVLTITFGAISIESEARVFVYESIVDVKFDDNIDRDKLILSGKVINLLNKELTLNVILEWDSRFMTLDSVDDTYGVTVISQNANRLEMRINLGKRGEVAFGIIWISQKAGESTLKVYSETVISHSRLYKKGDYKVFETEIPLKVLNKTASDVEVPDASFIPGFQLIDLIYLFTIFSVIGVIRKKQNNFTLE